MLRPVKALLIPAFVAGCALMFSGCEAGPSGSGINPKPPVTIAQANIPSSVNGGATFTVSVSLTSSIGSGGTASVQLVDVGTISPKIDCGAQQSVAIGGASTSFNCQAPQVNLGSSNTHPLQVDVNGAADLSSPVSVDVVNSGEVDVQLTSVSGTAITNAAPGQTIDVAFTTTTNPLGVGQYTVTAPTGWTVGNSGVCNVSVQSPTCRVPVTVAATAANGSYPLSIVAGQGSSPLSTTSLPISVVANSGEVDVQLTSVSGTAITNAAPGQTIDVAFATTTNPLGVGQYTVTAPTGWTVGNSGVCNVSVKSPTCKVPVTVAADAANGSYPLSIVAGQGSSPLSATSLPISVVANSGEVDVQLTSVSGTAITTATPGQTIGVAFTTTTTPPGAGEYTVAAPTGWTVGNSGVCSVSVQSPTCRVSVTVAANANGPYDLSITAGQGSSPLSATSLPISVQAQPPTSGMAVDLAQNISDTLYANLPSQAITFTYQPVFLFKNTSGGSLSIDTVNVSGLTNVQYGCNVTVNQQAEYTFSATPGCTLTATGLYAVSGDLSNTFTTPPPSAASPVGSASISIGILGGGTTYVQQDKTVVFVQYQSGTVAVRVVNSNNSTVHAAAYAGSDMIKFDSNGVGTVSSDPSGSDFQADQTTLSTSGGLLYMPYGAGELLDLTNGTGKFNSIAPPSVTASPAPPPFLTIEMTYDQNSPGGLCLTSPTCESLTVDQTYVDFISVMGSFNVMGNTLPLSLDTEAATHGAVTDLTPSQIFQGIGTFFDKQGSPWAYDSTRLQNYIQKDTNGNTTIILAPVQVSGVTSFDPMPSNYYDTYVTSLWTYLETNPIYVSGSGTGESDFATTAPANNCVLKGQVDTTPSSKTYNELVFSIASGTCPPSAYSIAGPYNGNLCGNAGGQLANQACADTPNLVFALFNECDFNGAAASGGCHEVVDPTPAGNGQPQPIDPATFFDNQNLWGPNGTYRAVVGRAIAAYQAAGLLPPCADPTETMEATNAQADIASGEGFSNPSCLGLLGSTPPTWNVYAAALRPYADVYAYTYGDFLGLDGTVSFSVNALPKTLYQNLQVAQPVTITLH